jgi:hypothetical protein
MLALWVLLLGVALTLFRTDTESFSVQDDWLMTQLRRADDELSLYRKLFGMSDAAKRQSQMLL